MGPRMRLLRLQRRVPSVPRRQAGSARTTLRRRVARAARRHGPPARRGPAGSGHAFRGGRRHAVPRRRRRAPPLRLLVQSRARGGRHGHGRAGLRAGGHRPGAGAGGARGGHGAAAPGGRGHRLRQLRFRHRDPDLGLVQPDIQPRAVRDGGPGLPGPDLRADPSGRSRDLRGLRPGNARGGGSGQARGGIPDRARRRRRALGPRQQPGPVRGARRRAASGARGGHAAGHHRAAPGGGGAAGVRRGQGRVPGDPRPRAAQPARADPDRPGHARPAPRRRRAVGAAGADDGSSGVAHDEAGRRPAEPVADQPRRRRGAARAAAPRRGRRHGRRADAQPRRGPGARADGRDDGRGAGRLVGHLAGDGGASR